MVSNKQERLKKFQERISKLEEIADDLEARIEKLPPWAAKLVEDELDRILPPESQIEKPKRRTPKKK